MNPIKKDNMIGIFSLQIHHLITLKENWERETKIQKKYKFVQIKIKKLKHGLKKFTLRSID